MALRGARRALRAAPGGGRRLLVAAPRSPLAAAARSLASSASSAAASSSPRDVTVVSSWATLDAGAWDGARPHTQQSLLAGEWLAPSPSARYETVPDPLNGEPFLRVPSPSAADLAPWVASAGSVTKSGLHNPFKNPARYVMLGRVSAAAGAALSSPPVAAYFARLVQRTSPKSYAQAESEVAVTAAFLVNYGGDNVRALARGFTQPGDHEGQLSSGHRWPFGPVAIVTPFNFPIEIPALQLMGALFMGNRVTLKVDSKVAVVMEQFLRLLHACGLPREDVDMLNCDGPTANAFLVAAQPRMTLFTGSSRVSEKLAVDLRGRLKVEDAGFDWKVLGPDVPAAPAARAYVAWQSDQDAYACSGQKCSAQSILFAHDNWVRAGFFDDIAALAARRRLADLTVGPVLTWSTRALLEHVRALAALPGARVLFGGRELAGHAIPAAYGAIEPTAVYVPLETLVRDAHFGLATTEVFGPVQVVTSWADGQLPAVLNALERMSHHLTAGVVSNDPLLLNAITGHTVNGTYYTGHRARTTGAPQNHWFGPAGDPRGAGIGTPEAIKLVWSCHREVVHDPGPIPADWTTPPPT